MPTSHQIHCINKSDRYDAHLRIKNIGGLNGDGSRWKLDETAAINGIENGTWQFYVRSGTHTVNVIISTSRYGNKYLKTVNDGDQPDNLLSLPECP